MRIGRVCTYDEIVSNAEGYGLVGSKLVHIVCLAGKRSLDMAYNGSEWCVSGW